MGTTPQMQLEEVFLRPGWIMLILDTIIDNFNPGSQSLDGARSDDSFSKANCIPLELLLCKGSWSTSHIQRHTPSRYHILASKQRAANSTLKAVSPRIFLIWQSSMTFSLGILCRNCRPIFNTHFFKIFKELLPMVGLLLHKIGLDCPEHKLLCIN